MKEEKIATRQSYGEILAKLGEKNREIVVLDADLSSATKTNIFAKQFPERFKNVGIAEQNLMGVAAGLATYGKIPYVSTFAAFAAGRAYDQIRSSICYPKLNVKICATHAGVTVGEDGATHQMLEDLSLMRSLPNIQVFSPSDDTQTKWLIEEISKNQEPTYVRLGRLATPIIYDKKQKFEIGKGVQHGEGTDATIFATGVTVEQSLKAQEELEKENIHVRVIDMFTIKPIDKEMIIKCAKETKKLITVEDHSIIGGLGSSVCEVLAEEYPAKVVRMGIKDRFGKSGKAEQLLKYFKIDSRAIVEKIKSIL
ncbi:MAG: transketolase family protein [Clostridia bacterium]|nr:transketolase family protein [Clostridia bacterium]